MNMNTMYAAVEPVRSEVDGLQGATLLEFGASWCGICKAAQPLLAAALDNHDHIRHLKVEDGPGKPLGRSFGVKLWPTLVFIRDGKEVSRLVRPTDTGAIREQLVRIDTAA